MSGRWPPARPESVRGAARGASRAPLAALLDRRADESFVGREPELASLESLLSGVGPIVCWVHGAAGIGKTALVERFARRARGRRARVLLFDGRAIEPTERGVVHALSAAVGGRSRTLAGLAGALAAMRRRIVLVLDNYEVLHLADAWLRSMLIPALPEQVRLVVVARAPPPSMWALSPEWRGFFCALALGPLSDRDARKLLAPYRLSARIEGRVRRSAGGIPLALRLAAETLVRNPAIEMEEVAAGSVVEELSRRYLSDIDDPPTRTAVEAACLVRRTTRTLLSAMIGDGREDAFDRLAALSFVQSDRDGLFVHEAVRTPVAAKLRSEDPAAYRRLRRSAWRQLRNEVRSAGLADLWRYTADLLYLIEHPLIRSAFFPSEVHSLAVEPARRDDGPAIAAIAERCEGPEASALLQSWWREAPDAFHVARSLGGGVAGFYCLLQVPLGRWTPQRDDPIVHAWTAHLQRNPVLQDQRVLFLRRWLTAASGESPSAEQAACFLDIKRTYLEMRPALRRVYTVVRDRSVWSAALAELGFRFLDERPEIDGAVHHSALLDFGPASVDGWLTELAARELGIEEDGVLDVKARALKVGNAPVPLTRLEFELLHFLLERDGEAVSREVLLREVWGHRHAAASSNVVDTVIRALRKKLGVKASLVETVRGVGYRSRMSAKAYYKH
jgi:hypothetical protein